MIERGQQPFLGLAVPSQPHGRMVFIAFQLPAIRLRLHLRGPHVVQYFL